MSKWLALCMAATIPALAADSARDIVRRSLDLQDRNFNRSRDYVYQQRQVTTETDSNGKPKVTKSRTFDVLRLYGQPYLRLIEKDGKALDAAGNLREEEKVRKAMEKFRRQADDPNSKERREYEKGRAETQRILREIPEAFEFRMVREEPVSGKPAWVIDAEPKPGYRAREPRAAMLGKMRGRLWIDQAEFQWVKVEAETIDTISFGLFLARLSRGSGFRFEQRRINDEIWLPSSASIQLDGRLALVKKVRAGIDITYSNYRKFQSDSKVVATSPLP